MQTPSHASTRASPSAITLPVVLLVAVPAILPVRPLLGNAHLDGRAPFAVLLCGVAILNVKANAILAPWVGTIGAASSTLGAQVLIPPSTS